MKKLSESLIINKNSKFYGYMYEISNINEVTDILSILKQKNKKANPQMLNKMFIEELKK